MKARGIAIGNQSAKRMVARLLGCAALFHGEHLGRQRLMPPDLVAGASRSQYGDSSDNACSRAFRPAPSKTSSCFER
jgi:hypothetical protein